MKEYPLTESDMEALALMGGGAALSFTGAGGALGFWLNVQTSIALSGPITDKVKGTWEAYSNCAGIAAIVLGIAGLVLVVLGGLKISRIKADTTFD